MDTINTLFTDIPSLDNLIKQKHLKEEANLFIRVHSAIHTKDTIAPLLQHLQAELPQAHIIGGSNSIVIYEGNLLRNQCLISFTTLADTEITSAFFSTLDKTPQKLAKEVKESNILQKNSIAFIFFTKTYQKIAKFIKECSTFASDVKMIGGVACDLEHSKTCSTPSFILHNNTISNNGVVICTLKHPDFITYSNAICGVEEIGQTYTITKAHGSYIEEINHQDATKWYCKLLDEQAFIKDPDISKVFPFVLPDQENTVRSIFYDNNQNKIHWIDNIDVPETIRLSYCSPHQTIKEARAICQDLMHTSAEAIFVYSCLVRDEIMNKCCHWELSPFGNTNISGALCCGEICNINGHNVYSNNTCSMLTLALNKEKKLSIHHENLDQITDLGFDNQHILTYLLKSTCDDMYQTNASLSRVIVEQNNQMLETLFTDPVTNLANLTKYLYDRNHMQFNKMCIINTQNAAMLRSHYGDEICNTKIANKVKRCKDFLNEPQYYFYQHNQDCFMICAPEQCNDETFLTKMRALFDYLGKVEYKEAEFFHVNEFAVVIHENELFEKAELTLSYIERSNQRFLLYYPNLGLEDEVETELECLANIKYAILHDGVEAHFQPIHDNTLHQISKYEALMRLRTKDGQLLYPNQFLDTAKKFKLYEDLSRQLIAKVMNLYLNSNDTVSINLSVQDIYSDETKALIYAQLQQTKTPQNIIFEIVESEEIHKDNILEDFIAKIRSYGAKIAIDDFGSGYSNLLKLVKLNADYIKIDGEIIRNMLQDETCRKILETILFLSRQMNTELIAEFVENDLIQTEIERLGIRFSQGYHFSKPKPYDSFSHDNK